MPPDPLDPDRADLARRLLRLVRRVRYLDRGELIVLAGAVERALERTEEEAPCRP